jgi:hypothetical protein
VTKEDSRKLKSLLKADTFYTENAQPLVIAGIFSSINLKNAGQAYNTIHLEFCVLCKKLNNLKIGILKFRSQYQANSKMNASIGIRFDF